MLTHFAKFNEIFCASSLCNRQPFFSVLWFVNNVAAMVLISVDINLLRMKSNWGTALAKQLLWAKYVPGQLFWITEYLRRKPFEFISEKIVLLFWFQRFSHFGERDRIHKTHFKEPQFSANIFSLNTGIHLSIWYQILFMKKFVWCKARENLQICCRCTLCIAQLKCWRANTWI